MIRSTLRRPCFLCIGGDSAGFPTRLAVNDAIHADAEWIDVPLVRGHEGEDEWMSFVNRMPKQVEDRGMAVAIFLSAPALLRQSEEVRRSDAALLRRRLGNIAHALGSPISIYIIIDQIDLLYGWRSLAAMLPANRLKSPLGFFGDGESAGVVMRQALATLRRFCRIQGGPEPYCDQPRLAAAALTASMEARRLETPLMELCGQVFSGNERLAVRGVFFGSNLPPGHSAHPVSPLAAALPSFVPLDEPRPEEESWFLGELLLTILPNAERKRASGNCRSRLPSAGRRMRAATVGLLLGTLILCSALTFSFVESRRILLSVSGRAGSPARADDLADYRRLAETVRQIAEKTVSPPLGLTQSLALADALEQRFIESYFALKTVPDVEAMQDAALAAARSGNAVAKGNALLGLLLFRHAVQSSSDSTPGARQTYDRLRSLALDLSLADEEELRQLESYLAWAGPREWMTETIPALAEFEHYLMADAARWLPDWVDDLPPTQLAFVSPESGFTPRPAWTRDGYRAARELLEAIQGGNEISAGREQALASYRREALSYWLRAAERLGQDLSGRAAGDNAKRLLEYTAQYGDPETRFLSLASHHVLPMFEDSPQEAYPMQPEVIWLRNWRSEAHSESISDPVNISRRIKTMAANQSGLRETVRSRFHGNESGMAPSRDRFGQTDGGAGWFAVSPAAAHDRMRIAALRSTAEELDELWSKTVYNPCILAPGGPEKQNERLWTGDRLLESFLTGPAQGFWMWRDGEMDRAVWDGASFPFSDEFLAFCTNTRRMADHPIASEIPLMVSVKSVGVSGTLREHPVAVEFFLAGAGWEDVIVYRNYSTRRQMTLRRNPDGGADVERSGIRLVFPSFTAVREFEGQEGLREFATLLDGEKQIFQPLDFGDSAPALRRLGVTSLVIRAELENRETAFNELDRSVMALPPSIIDPIRLSPLHSTIETEIAVKNHEDARLKRR